MPDRIAISVEARGRAARYALLVVAYFAAGKLGLMLALPPGYASAIFPPAGIAIAAALTWGRPSLPWIFLGSFLLNLWTGVEASHGIDGTGAMAAVIIAGASTIQAAFGGYCLRRLIGWPTPLDNSREILRFLLSTPIICLFSSTLSVAGLCAVGVIGAGQAAESWATWWVGDTLGLIVMLPLVLVAIGEPRELWRRRTLTVAVPMLLAFALLVTFFFRVSKWEHEETLLEFRLLSQQTADRVQTQFDEQASLLEQLSGFFQAGRHVTREDYRRFVSKSLARFPMIAALDWAPQIDRSGRRSYEATMNKEIPGFEILERGPDQKLVRAAERPQYFPVTYVEPIVANKAALGFDLASSANRNTALLRSIDTGAPVTSAPVRLVQESSIHPNGILIFLPVPGGGNGAGVVLTVIEMHRFMEKLVASAGDRLLVRFEDVDQQEILYGTFPPGTQATFERSFDFGTRSYRLQTAPSQFYLDHHRGWQSWSVLVAGIFGVGLLGGLLLLSTGYTARVEATVVERTRRLAKSESQLKAAQRIAHVGSWDNDLQNGVLTWSDETKRIYEVASDDFVPSHQTILAAVHPDDREQVEKHFAESHGSRNPYTTEHRLLFPDGRIKYIRVHGETSFDASGQPLHSMGTVQDVTERRLAQEQIRQLAYYDTLTELPNRRLLLDRLQQAVAQAKHFRRSMAVMFLDLDRFKYINDTLGHDVGDEVLKAVSKRIVLCVRSGDTVSRQGGDEFVIVLAETAHPEDASRVAEKIIAALDQPIPVGTHLLRVTTSIGIAIYPVDGTDDVLALMKKADIAMYAAKESGRNKYQFYRAELEPPEKPAGED